MNQTDYFPFGMEISSRTAVGTYRYGYNGMEQDPEVKGEGNSYTTEFRQYDPRIGRWLSLDPLASSFPWQSPYCAFDNNPIYFTDPLGLAAEGGPGDPPAAGTNRTNPATGTVYTADGNGGWIQNIEEVNVKPQSLNDYTSAAVENNSNNQVKQVSESTNPNVPNYALIKENQLNTKEKINYQPPVMEQKLMADHMELAVRNYKNYGAIANPLHTAMTTVVKLSTGQDVTMQDAVWSVVDVTPVKYIKIGKHLVPKAAKQVSKEVVEVAIKKVGWEIEIAKDVANYYKIADSYLDCSDIASSLNKKYSGGYVLEITPKTGRWMKGMEYGKKLDFTYHQVFVKGKFVYDPMFGNKPILTSDFIKAYQKLNPGGINLIKQ